MTSRKCHKKHYLETDQISQSGRDFKFLTYVYTNFYCYKCNKARKILNVYFNKPKIFRKKKNSSDDLPF